MVVPSDKNVEEYEKISKHKDFKIEKKKKNGTLKIL